MGEMAPLMTESADRRVKLDREMVPGMAQARPLDHLWSYAAHGIAEYWVVDLPNRLLHIHRDAKPGGYAQVVAQAWGETVYPLCAPDIAIRPSDRLKRVIK